MAGVVDDAGDVTTQTATGAGETFRAEQWNVDAVHAPQAWAAGAPFLMLQAILGLSAKAHENVLTVNKPQLPPWLNTVELRNLRIGQSTISLVFRREGEITGFALIDRKGDVRVLMEE